MKLSDQVIARIVQVIQEGMLLGVDVTDIMRQIDVVVDGKNQSQLVLTDEYVKMVDDHYSKLLKEADELKGSVSGNSN